MARIVRFADRALVPEVDSGYVAALLVYVRAIAYLRASLRHFLAVALPLDRRRTQSRRPKIATARVTSLCALISKILLANFFRHNRSAWIFKQQFQGCSQISAYYVSFLQLPARKNKRNLRLKFARQILLAKHQCPTGMRWLSRLARHWVYSGEPRLKP
jgi:hypothetical protein